MGNAKKTSLSEGEMSVQTERSEEAIFMQPVIGMIFYICARKSSPAHIFSAQPPCRAFTAIVLYILRS